MRRRDFAFTPLLPFAAARAERQTSYGHQYPDMLLNLLAKRINETTAKWDAERARIRTARTSRRGTVMCGRSWSK
jgi:hypothetical protein